MDGNLFWGGRGMPLFLSPFLPGNQRGRSVHRFFVLPNVASSWRCHIKRRDILGVMFVWNLAWLRPCGPLSSRFIWMAKIGLLQSPLCICVSTTLPCSPRGFLLERICLTNCVLPLWKKHKERKQIKSRFVCFFQLTLCSYSAKPYIWHGEISQCLAEKTHVKLLNTAMQS